jgi:putative Mg2+ transporter-C (MgtC) family protein
MWIIDFFCSPTTIDIVLKLLIAFLLSALIGIEREIIHKPAGIKTHTLVCISSALILDFGMYLTNIYGPTVDPSRIPAQILSGIGFVGAGTIIRDGFSVKGITTAASLLAITCIGLAVGAGYYAGAIFATIFIFLILILTAPFQMMIDTKRKMILFTITAHTHSGMIGEIEKVFEENNIEIINIKHHNDPVSQYTSLKVFAKCSDKKTKESIIQRLCKLKDIKEIYTSKKSYQPDVE